MLAQNLFYIVPIVNVDGVAYIEDEFNRTGQVPMKRKNMNPHHTGCPDKANNGVDLNRNYAKYWDKPGGNSVNTCEEAFRGDAPFSEPETRAIRDLLTSKRNDIRFVYNFHAYGNMYLWPYNGESPNNIGDKNPDVLRIYEEIWHESKFPDGTLSGNAYEALEYTSSGEQSDWILSELGIPSICPEMGSSDLFSYQFILPYRRVMIRVLRENINWLEHTYDKIGNQFKVDAKSYEIEGSNLVINFRVTNQGLSD